MRLQAVILGLALALPAAAQWTTNVWPSWENPRALSEQLMQCWSGVWERLQVCGSPLPQGAVGSGCDFADGTWTVNGDAATNTAGWRLETASGNPPVLTQGTVRVVVSATLTPPSAEVFGDCWAASATWASLTFGGTLETAPAVEASTNGTDWASVASAVGPETGWRAERVPVLHKGASRYRLRIASTKKPGGYDTLAISNVLFKSMFARYGWTNVVALKREIAAVATNFLDVRAATGPDRDLTAYLETNPAVAAWTATGLLAAIGAPTNYWDVTWPRALTSDTNGIRYLTNALAELVATETPFRWACSAAPAVTSLNARGFWADGWHTNWSDGDWDATRSNVLAVLSIDLQHAIAPGFEWFQHTPYWFGFAADAYLVETNSVMPYAWAGGTNAPWTYSAGGLYYEVLTNAVAITNDLISPGYLYTTTEAQVSAVYTQATTAVVWTVDSERFAGFVRCETNVTGAGDPAYVTNEVEVLKYAAGTVTGTVTIGAGDVWTNKSLRAGAVSQHAYACASNPVVAIARDVDWYYRCAAPWRPPMVNGALWDERADVGTESPDFHVAPSNLAATFDSGGSERVATNFLRFTRTNVAEAVACFTGRIGRAGQTSTNIADWLPDWPDEPTVDTPTTARGWAVTNAIAIERWRFLYR